MLNILEGFDLGALGPVSAERIHLEVEAKKLAFKDLHEKIGDPEFSEIPTEELLSKDYAAKLRGRISPARVGASVASEVGSDTTYLCAVDAAGNGCSFINSLYDRFGSGIVAEGTGVCLHNRGRSFRLVPDHPNALAPGKRPLHTIIPGLATSAATGALWATFGVMAAAMQPQGHAQLLANLLVYDMSPQEGVEHPRHRHEHDVLLVEGRVPETEVQNLRSRGHNVEVGPNYAIPTGGAQLIRVLEGGVRACGSDPRKDGCALAQ
jgi:gamma-glutamyltranspeptidase/glutathione hydrolase